MTCPTRFRSWLPLAVSLVLVAPSVARAQGIEKPRIPLQTALSEIRAFREAYADAYNKKDSATVMDMYAPEAIMLGADGAVLSGKDAIGKSLGDAQSWPQLTITSDTLRVVGHTAWDIGTTKSEESGGGEHAQPLPRRTSAWLEGMEDQQPGTGAGGPCADCRPRPRRTPMTD